MAIPLYHLLEKESSFEFDVVYFSPDNNFPRLESSILDDVRCKWVGTILG